MSNLKSKIEELKSTGKNNAAIIEDLKKEGHSAQEIYDAMSNKENSEDLAPPTPSEEMGAETQEEAEETSFMDSDEPETKQEDFISQKKFQTPSQIPKRHGIEDIEEIAESIISEKMDELSVSINDISIWKEKTSTEIEAIKQEILRIRNQFENIQNTMLGKVESYKQSISDVNLEMKTLSKVLEKILQPMTENVKELSRITERFKK